MKNIALLLVIVGIVLVGFGLYNAIVPQEVLNVGPLEVSAKEGMSTNTIVTIALGLVALFAGGYLKRRG
jgi:hypothetical protein